MDFETLPTERMYLRKVTAEVYRYVFENYDEAALQAFFGNITAAELARERSKNLQGLEMFGKSFLGFQLLARDTGKVLGSCGFHTWYVEHQRAEIGYALLEEGSKGKGLMTEALRVILPYGFEQMGLHRIEAFLSLENTPSLRLVQKFGFQQEGILREHYYKNGRIEDSAVFGLLRHELKL